MSVPGQNRATYSVRAAWRLRVATKSLRRQALQGVVVHGDDGQAKWDEIMEEEMEQNFVKWSKNSFLVTIISKVHFQVMEPNRVEMELTTIPIEFNHPRAREREIRCISTGLTFPRTLSFLLTFITIDSTPPPLLRYWCFFFNPPFSNLYRR